MKIILCSDEHYAMPCAACIASIFENNKDEQVEVDILTNGFCEETVVKFNRLASSYSQRIGVITVDDSKFVSLKVSFLFPKSIYYRFLIPSLFPQCDKALYLDCDIIVNGQLTSLWNTSLEGQACACVEDQTSDDIRHSHRTGVAGSYFNSGMMLINLKYWREHNIAEKCIEFINEHPERCLYPDQDALNHVLANKVIWLPYCYNFQYLMYGDKYGLMLSRDKWSEIDKNKGHEVIVHYSFFIKPWHKDCSHPLRDLFFKYLAFTPWAGFKPYSRRDTFFRKAGRFFRRPTAKNFKGIFKHSTRR